MYNYCFRLTIECADDEGMLYRTAASDLLHEQKVPNYMFNLINYAIIKYCFTHTHTQRERERERERESTLLAPHYIVYVFILSFRREA